MALPAPRNHRTPRTLALAAALLLTLSACGGKSDAELIASAKAYLAKNDVKAATIDLKSALQKNPQSAEARYLLGKALLETGDVQGALVELGKARDQHQDDSRVLPLLARAQLAAGQARAVTEQYADVQLSDPKAGAELKALVGSAYVALGQIDRCQAMVTAALQLDPKNVDARLLQARLTAGRGAFDEALAGVRAVIADEPRQAAAHTLEGEMLWVGKRDIPGAVKAFRAALALAPRDMQAHVDLVQLYLSSRDIPNFKAQAQALSQAQPGSFQARYYQVQLDWLQGDLKGARNGADQLLRMAPQFAPALQLAGAVELDSGLVTLAQTHLTQAVQIAPGVPLARRLLARADLRAGEPGKAIKALQPLVDGAQPDGDTLGLVAEAYLQSGNTAQAEKYYALAAKAAPDDVKAKVALALMQVAQGSATAGFAQLESLAAADKSSYADLALVSALVRKGQLPQALKAVDRLQAKLPGKPLPSLLRGRIQILAKNLAGARASFDQAVAADPVYFPAVAELAALDMAQQKPDDARKRLEAFIAREPRNVGARLALAGVRQQSGAKPEEVERLLKDAIDASPEDAAPRLAQVQHFLGLRRFNEALAAAQSAAAAMPDNVQVLDALGRAQWAAGDTQQAISTFQKIASLSKSPEPFLRLAGIYTSAKDYPSAVRNLQKALEVSPGLMAAQASLIQVDLANKQPAEALKVARQVQAQRPTESAGYVLEADIHISQHDWTPAVAALRMALQKQPATDIAKRLHALYVVAGRGADADQFATAWLRDHPRDADFLFHLGSMAMDRKDYAAAEARYRQVLTLLPDNASALNNVAWLMVQLKEPGALPLAEKANQLLPNQPGIQDTLATVLAAEGKPDQALAWQKKAVAAAPDVPGYRLNLARLLIATGDRTQAKAELEKLAALGGRFADQAEV
ncbi:MAG: PEP-CTERM system TPR-repeat protein PrsT, partial [Burkholderiales bacterium]|nr:PEP-CTERM system TPR-repeat protein PrsT [Burkholderiales bacterium]